MSMLTDIRHFLKQYFKNPVLITAVAYIVYRILNNHLKKENFTERVKEIKKIGKWLIIKDSSLNVYILVDETGSEVYSSKSLNLVEDEAKRRK